MTNKEMIAELRDILSSLTCPMPIEDAVFEAKEMLYALIAALESELEPLAVVKGWIHEDDWLNLEKASGQVLGDTHWCPIPVYGQVERGRPVTLTIAERHEV